MCGCSVRASDVGCSRPPTRWNSAKPSCSSACCSVRLTAGWVTLIMRAAALTLPVSMMALKTSIWRNRMAGHPTLGPMLRWLIVVFLALVLINGLTPWLRRLGLGRLPGISTSACSDATGSFRWPARCC